MKIINKIKCKILHCKYDDKNLRKTLIEDYENIGLFRVENQCVRCGKHFSILMRLPK